MGKGGKEMYQNDNQELDEFKKINLIEYLKLKSWTVDTKDSDKKQNGFTALRKAPDEKIIVKNNNGSWFYSNQRAKNKGSIIDYLKNFENMTLGQVRQELRPYLNKSSFPPSPIFYLNQNEELRGV
jgi:hypothetical protein